MISATFLSSDSSRGRLRCPPDFPLLLHPIAPPSPLRVAVATPIARSIVRRKKYGDRDRAYPSEAIGSSCRRPAPVKARRWLRRRVPFSSRELHDLRGDRLVFVGPRRPSPRFTSEPPDRLPHGLIAPGNHMRQDSAKRARDGRFPSPFLRGPTAPCARPHPMSRARWSMPGFVSPTLPVSRRRSPAEPPCDA